MIESMDYVDYVKTVYLYDSDSRPIQTVRYNAITGTVSAEFSESAIYNSVGLTSSISDSYLLNGSVYSNSYHYAYDEQQRLTAMHYDSTTSANRYTYAYDGLSRVTGKTLTYGGLSVSQTLGYLEGENSYDTENATSRVESLTSKVGSTTTGYAFTYDDRGNITAIRVDGVLKYSYEYDNLNQLVRENNAVANKTYVYTYDDAGNILTKKTYAYTTGTLGSVQSTYSYTYGNSQWGDQLTAYRGTTITYDSLGNPLSYYNGSSYTLSWTKGRQLASTIKGGITTTYSYNADGIRTGKNVGGTAVEYMLDGSQILAEKNGSTLLRYFYDANSSPVGMMIGSTYYLYEKNLQGDIVGIYTTSGLKVASYSYDAWGNTVSSSYTSGYQTAHDLNPFRYRGYYYDTESGFYYLQSRYYDPTTGRFLNTDHFDVILASPEGLTDKNLYAYCDNNPIMRIDSDGEFWNIVIGGIVGGVVNAIGKVISETVKSIKNPDEFDLGDSLLSVGISFGIGVAEGMLTAIIPGASSLINAGGDSVEALIDGLINNDSFGEIAVNIVCSFAIGAYGGAGGGSFAKGNDTLNTGINMWLKGGVQKGMHPQMKREIKKAIAQARNIIKNGFKEEFGSWVYDALNEGVSWVIKKSLGIS